MTWTCCKACWLIDVCSGAGGGHHDGHVVMAAAMVGVCFSPSSFRLANHVSEVPQP
jgi:hypothetical protein